MLAESWTITDEPDEPEPMEIARDAGGGFHFALAV